jgi:soluble lytic murein transglycosylase-like protein
MSIKNLSYTTVFFVLVIFLLSSKENGVLSIPMTSENDPIKTHSQTVSLQMYDAIMKYSEIYDIPKRYAFGIAYAETRYEGPFHWKYNPKQTSCVGALGPMQIMPSTGRSMWKDKTFTNEYLKNDIDFNVHTSMKLLRKLHDQYGNWKLVFGCYNTGRPMINEYAENVYNHKINWKLK